MECFVPLMEKFNDVENFTEEEKGWLAQASNYLKEIKERKNLIIIPFEKYK